MARKPGPWTEWGKSLLPSDPDEAAVHMREARTIYQRLGYQDAERTLGRLPEQEP